MLLVTSFNESLYQDYGKRMVREFSEKTDGSVKLIVIYEHNSTPDVRFRNVEFICFKNQEHQEFIQKFGHLHEARGLRINYLNDNRINLHHDYRYDAIRFSFKIFSLLQAIQINKSFSHFAWIDADIRCLNKFSKYDLIKFFPDKNELMSYLGRDNFPIDGAYSECGFLGFNINNILTKEFLNRVAQVYITGEIFKYKQWHDSWIWDQIRIEYEKKNVHFKNISGKASKTEHPFINCDLGIYFDHLKGPERKKNGKSFDADFKQI